MIMSVQNEVPLHPVDAKMCHGITENFDLLVLDVKHITKCLSNPGVSEGSP